MQNLLHKPNYQSVFVLQGRPVAWAPHTANRAKPMRMTWQVRAWHRLRPHRWQTPPPSLPSFPCTAVVCRHSPARARLGKGEFTPAAAQLLDAQERLRLPQTGHGMRMEPRSAAASQVRLLDQAQPGPNSPAKHPQLARPLRHRVGSDRTHLGCPEDLLTVSFANGEFRILAQVFLLRPFGALATMSDRPVWAGHRAATGAARAPALHCHARKPD